MDIEYYLQEGFRSPMGKTAKQVIISTKKKNTFSVIITCRQKKYVLLQYY